MNPRKSSVYAELTSYKLIRIYTNGGLNGGLKEGNVTPLHIFREPDNHAVGLKANMCQSKPPHQKSAYCYQNQPILLYVPC
jgi:hypothetical protein